MLHCYSFKRKGALHFFCVLQTWILAVYTVGCWMYIFVFIVLIKLSYYRWCPNTFVHLVYDKPWICSLSSSCYKRTLDKHSCLFRKQTRSLIGGKVNTSGPQHAPHKLFHMHDKGSGAGRAGRWTRPALKTTFSTLPHPLSLLLVYIFLSLP